MHRTEIDIPSYECICCAGTRRQNFLCIRSASAAPRVSIQPRQSWHGKVSVKPPSRRWLFGPEDFAKHHQITRLRQGTKSQCCNHLHAANPRRNMAFYSTDSVRPDQKKRRILIEASSCRLDFDSTKNTEPNYHKPHGVAPEVCAKFITTNSHGQSDGSSQKYIFGSEIINANNPDYHP